MKFKSDIEVQAGLKDYSGSAGTSGQVLSSDGTSVSWIDAEIGVARDVQNQVKAGVAINKGQAVYVTGADGTNIIVGLASNASEATSSKTLGLLNATVAANGFADVVQIGKLAGLNTIGATVGDPVWLGANGNLIYGLANKPYAPLHLVYIGVVTRVNANNGEIFVSVQNGFELKEIHDVSAQTPSNNNGIFYNTSNGLWEAKAISAAGGIEGSGTTNYVSKFTGASTIGNSLLYDNGTNVGIGTTSPTSKLHVDGNIYSSGYFNSNNIYLGKASTLFTGGSVNDGGLMVSGSNNLIFGNALTERMRITSTGNVGIGTTAPAERLSIVGSTDYRTIFLERNLTANTAQRTGIVSKTYSGANNFGLIGGADISGTSADVTIGYTGSVGANQIILYTAPTYNGGQAERMRITSAGNVGIGTTTVPNTLSVGMASSTTGKGISLTSSAGIEYARFGVINSTVDNTSYIGSISNNNFAIYANNAERMRITSGGNLLIGTTTDAGAKLAVTGNIYNNGDFRIGASYGATNTGIIKSVSGVLSLFTWGDSTNIQIGGNDVIFKPEVGTERMRITSSGNVGIGTTSPTRRLEVASDGSNWISGTFSGTGGTDKVVIGNLAGATIGSHSTALNAWSDFTIAGTDIKFSPYGSEAMRVAASGNVGIGTTSPTSKLHVVGDVYSSGYFNSNNIYLGKGSDLFTGGSANDGGLMVSGSNNLIFGNALTERMRLTTNGELLIGRTTSYGAGWQLAVEGNIYAKNDLRIDANASFGGSVGIGTASTPATKLQVDSANMATDTIGNVFISATNALAANIGGQLTLGGFYNGSSKYAFGGIAARKENATSGNVAGYLALMSTTSAGALTERMRITSGGDVGIGTTSPAAKLDVNGVFRSIVTSISSTGEISAKILGYPTSPFGLIFRSYSSGATSIQSQREASNSELFPLLLQPLGGNVGIGTTTDAGYKLDVNGTGRYTGALTASSVTTTVSTFANATLGTIASTWGGTLYPTLYGSSADRWVMHINPHISYTQNGTNGYTGSMTGSTVRMASDPAANSYWDIGVGTSGVAPDRFAIGREGSYFLTINNSGNVGIGTQTPTLYSNYRTLALNNTGGSALELKVNDASALKIFSAVDQSYFYESRNMPLAFYTNSTYAGQISPAGNWLLNWATDGGYRLFVNGTSMFTGNVTAPNYYFRDDAYRKVPKCYAKAVDISHSAYSYICTVSGSALASSTRITIQGTSGNVVVNFSADILVNHYQDILITAMSGFYTQLDLRVISNGNESFSIEAKTISAPQATTCYVELFPLNDESVDFSGTAQSGSTLTMTSRPGTYTVGTGGNQGDISAGGSINAAETISSNGNATFGNTANRRVNYDSNGGNFRIKANSGGWAMGYFFDGSSGTYRGGFGGFGGADTLTYYWIGSDYNIPTMIVQPNQGNVMIGTTTDSGYKLDVNGTGRFNGNLQVGQGSAGSGTPTQSVFQDTYGGNREAIYVKNTADYSNGRGTGYGFLSGTGTQKGYIRWSADDASQTGYFLTLSVTNSSGTLIAPLTLASSGAASFISTVTATGFFNSSDNRLKELIDYDYNVSDIKPITYLWKDGRDNKKHVGYSAQEVQKVMPDAVNEDSDGMLSVNYVEVLVAQVNFLTKRIEELEKIVSK